MPRNIGQLKTSGGPQRLQRLQSQLFLPLRQGAQAERVEADEAFRVVLVVGDRTLLEGDEVLVVERIFALAADHRGIALVEPQPHAAGDHLPRAADRKRWPPRSD